ncbi:restriction endonuclease subunit S [Aliarcobacter cryaerophilus]|uniref:restriction endonuclease subunit S n=1 Tax=Aliarcobacter cryaerophilus TaxID=28198 RepID=UPI0013DE514A|nr:restriction endonuclease subunit S [Aliarcobacter cryaerophilus]
MAELYSLPNGWEWKKLEEITELITKGTTPTTNGYKFQNSGINFLKIENIINGDIDLSTIEMFISEEAHQSQKRSQLKEYDVLFSIAGTIGDTAIVKKEHLPMNINQAIALIRPKNILNSFFLKYSLLSIISQNTKNKQRGGAIKNISLGDIKDLNYPLPPLEEQKRIVAKLDILFAKIDKAIALHQKNIDEADIFMASVLNDVFVELEEKYEKKYLDEISFLIDGDRGSNYPKKEEFFENEFCLFLNAKNVTRNGFLFLEKQFIRKEKDSLLRKGKLDREDLIITTRGTIGNVAIYDKSIEFDNVRINSGMAIIRLKEKNLIYNRYIYKYLFAPQFLNYLSDVQSGSAQPQITIKNLKESIVPIPPLKTQQKVVAYLDEISNKIEKIKQIQKEKMQSLKELKASILDKAFKGEL